MRIDSHQHFWDPADPWFGWPTPDLSAIRRPYGPEDLRPLLRAARIDRTVLVQVAPDVEETVRFLEIAETTDFVGGVVGWAGFDQPDAAETIERLAEHRALRGLRPMLQAIEETEWILRPAVEPAVAAMLAAGLSFDALVQPRHLDVLARFADRHPRLPIVVDHGAKPQIHRGAAGFEPWASEMRRLAERSQVYCKVSGLLTEAGPSPRAADLDRYVDHLLECFGPSRLMWGSDWPVVTLAAGYGEWHADARVFFSDLSEEEQAAVFGDTAARFYRL